MKEDLPTVLKILGIMASKIPESSIEKFIMNLKLPLGYIAHGNKLFTKKLTQNRLVEKIQLKIQLSSTDFTLLT